MVHDDIKDITGKLKQIPSCGYNLLGYFSLPEDVWWIDYYGSIENKIQELCLKYIDDLETLTVLGKKNKVILRYSKKSFNL